MKKIFTYAIALFIALAFVYVGCKKDNNDPSSNTSVTTSLNIKVMDKLSTPIAGVEINCYNKSGFTASDGTATLTDIGIPEADKDRMIMILKKNGYFESSVGVKPNAGSETYFEAVLSDAELAGTVNNNTGGIVTNSSGTIFMDFPPNSLAYEDGTPYSGDANIYTAFHTPDDENFALSMPGGPDMLALNSNGEEGSMISYGAISVEAKTPEMKSLQLTGLKSSNVQVNSQIANSMLAEAPATIPIWRLNEETAVWEEIGTGYKQGNRYEYEVDHFSAINKDVFINFDGALTLIKGDVCDDSLNPLPFARVDVDQRTVFANELGYFEVNLPSNRVYTFESEYCTKIEGPFAIGEDNYVDLCCEEIQDPGFFRISVDGTYQNMSIDEDFEFSSFGYFFYDTIIQGTNYNDWLYIGAGGPDQYWGLPFTFANFYTSTGTFTGPGTYSLIMTDSEVIFLGTYFPNADTTNYVFFGCESGTITINDYQEGDKMEGYFSMQTSSAQLDVVIEGEFEVYEWELEKKAQEMIDKMNFGINQINKNR
ncbi:MAG: hypothetical protein K9H16_00830 [Bacteroidales bacterium]|nr:hypothetical protein [Bacteroidales bacterium]